MLFIKIGSPHQARVLDCTSRSPGNLLGRNPIMSDFTLGKLFSPSASLSILYEITFARQTSSTLKIDGDGCKQHFLKIWRSKKKIRRVIKILFWNSKDSLTSCKDANHCMKNDYWNCRCHFLNCENCRENAKSQNKNIGLGVVVGQMVKFNINRGCDSFKKMRPWTTILSYLIRLKLQYDYYPEALPTFLQFLGETAAIFPLYQSTFARFDYHVHWGGSFPIDW